MSTVSAIKEPKFYLLKIEYNNLAPFAAGLIISTILPALGKYISRNDTRWKWIVVATPFGINLAIFRHFTPFSNSTICLTSSVLTVGGWVLADLFITTRRKTYLNNPFGSAPKVLDSLFPAKLSSHNPHKPLFYFYVATETGFTLILYDSNPAGNLMRNFTHGCDSIGAVVDPMITDVQMRRIPDNLYAQIISHMHRENGVPSFLALQGIWTSPLVPRRDLLLNQPPETTQTAPTTTIQTISNSPDLLRLLSGQTKYEEYPGFDLQLIGNTWIPMPQTPNLRGFSFRHLNKALVVWVHESNDQALGSAIQAAQTESRRLAGKINTENSIIKAARDFLNQRMNRNTLLRKIPSARTHIHSQNLIQTIRSKAATDDINPEVTQLQNHTQKYLYSLTRKKECVDKQLAELQQVSQQLQNVQGNEHETQRIITENAQKLPTSAAKSTLQVKQTTPTKPEMILHLKRETLIDLITIFNKYRDELVLLFSKATTASNLLAAGKDLLRAQATWISRNPNATTIINMQTFERDINYHLGDITIPTWRQFEWLLKNLNDNNDNFVKMRSTEFLTKNVAWLEQAVTHLFNLLQISGEMHIEFEMEIAPLQKRLGLLQGDQPLYLTKRLSSGGQFLHDVSTNAKTDPLAREDDVHIEV